jgi:uncharacterized protein
MVRNLRPSLLALLVLLALGAPWAAPWAAAQQSLQPVPPLQARVTDLTGTLTAAQQAQFESELAAFQARKGAQVAVLIVATTQPEQIEQYSIRVVEAWKLGREKPDDGVLLLVAKEDRTVRIEVGRGLEGAVTDLVSKRIIDEAIVPMFRQGDYAGGIRAGLDRLTGVIEGEPLPEPDQGWSGKTPISDVLPFLVAVVLVGSTVLRALFGRVLGAAATGGIAGLIAFAASQALALSIGAGVMAALVALVLGFGGGGRGRWSSRPHHGGYGGGFGGGFGSGGGGFGGGGGSFGGGGASGRW